MPELNLDYLNARTLLTKREISIGIVLAGCGGTGSWLAPAVGRITRLLTEQGTTARLIFLDPDCVEAKNVYRQNFCDAEIGLNKAEALAARYGMAWGIEITAMSGGFEKAIVSIGGRVDFDLVVGCVDNAAARRSIHDYVSRSWRTTWWLDCGNEESSGQILLGAGKSPENDPFMLPGNCTWLPSPALQHPELLKKKVGTYGISRQASCADLVLQDAQGLSINACIAAEAADYLVRLLITRDLRKYATYLDLASGTTRSEYITEANIRKFIKASKHQGG